MLCILLYIYLMNETFVTNWKSQVKKGTLTFIILNILKGHEYYGYELIEQIKQHTDMDIAEGTLYPLMNRLKTENLVDSKWVEQETGIPRKYYCLTPVGIKTLAQMNAYWKNLESSIHKIIK
ncbi:PadR family transcriptional regulator PadR [Chitinophaga dinghuensis]|uniref:PadR family transcriptional regulator PadR n=2 Tax=Chitinophaga dinghuensis TaxID=1539050 RepID=A0A327VSL1_9BACT|nr:PadR family transcriptional regulator PadR [Chitinophaga dinghuensis]